MPEMGLEEGWELTRQMGREEWGREEHLQRCCGERESGKCYLLREGQ